MIPLHSIRSAAFTRYVWGVAYGRNSRALGQNVSYWENPVYHAYLVERGTPPEIHHEARPMLQSRAYWNPWYVWHQVRDVEWFKTPLCGRIRTQSQRPNINFANGRYGNAVRNRCPDCLALAPDITYMDMLQVDDPWTRMTREARLTQPDPVSGV